MAVLRLADIAQAFGSQTQVGDILNLVPDNSIEVRRGRGTILHALHATFPF
jgi:hypothetical protein